MSQDPGEITQLLRRLSRGDRGAEDDLIAKVYGELRRLASHYARSERTGHTLQTTALVNEAYLKLAGRSGVAWNDRNHFFAVASRVMRQILVDYARARLASKRGAEFQIVGLEFASIMSPQPDDMILALEEALQRLEQLDSRQTQIVVMRFYGGLTEEEIGEVLGISARTVKRDWILAKTWLHAELSAHDT